MVSGSCHCSAYGCGLHPHGSNFFKVLFFRILFSKIRFRFRVILGKVREKEEVRRRGEAKYT